VTTIRCRYSAWEVAKEGHDVEFYINDAAEKEIADGRASANA
jgi:hypothetical protein